jgi:hypothetical protein
MPKYVLKKIAQRSAMTAIASPYRKAEKDHGSKRGEAELNHGVFQTPRQTYLSSAGLSTMIYQWTRAGGLTPS